MKSRNRILCVNSVIYYFNVYLKINNFTKENFDKYNLSECFKLVKEIYTESVIISFHYKIILLQCLIIMQEKAWESWIPDKDTIINDFCLQEGQNWSILLACHYLSQPSPGCGLWIWKEQLLSLLGDVLVACFRAPLCLRRNRTLHIGWKHHFLVTV